MVGKANKVDVLIQGNAVQALLDTGSMISTMAAKSSNFFGTSNSGTGLDAHSGRSQRPSLTLPWVC